MGIGVQEEQKGRHQTWMKATKKREVKRRLKGESNTTEEEKKGIRS